MPHVLPSVRVVITDEAGAALLLQRAPTGYGAGRWCLPGGKIDYGETVAAAAVKELREETGLVCQGQPEFLWYQDSLPEGPGDLHVINFYFTCLATGPLRLNRESSAAAWVTSADLADYDIAFGNAAALARYFAQAAD